MKRKIIFALSLCAITSILFFQVGCKKKPLDGINLGVATDVFVAPTMILFENAKAGATIQPENFTLTISGQDADKVVSAIGTKTFKVQNGFININLEKGTVASRTNPIIFTISGSVDGFESFRKDIRITSADEQVLTFKIVEVGNLPEGITETTNTTALVNGVFTSSEVIQTSAGNGTSQSTKLTIAAGTTMSDANGNVLTGNSVVTKVRFYDPKTESREVFPGGLSPNDVTDLSGNKVQGGGTFYSSGLIAINMTVGTSTVSTFSTPVAAEIELASDQVDFSTGNAIQAGATIPLWSCNEQTGAWKEEGTANVVNIGGKLVAQFDMPHLSYWNLDFFTWENNISEGNNLDVNFTCDGVYQSSGYIVTLHTASGQVATNPENINISNGSRLTVARPPNISGCYLKVTNTSNNKQVSYGPFNPGTKGSIDININSIIDPDLVHIALKYNVKCTKGKIKPNAGTFIVVTDILTKVKQVFRTPSITSADTEDMLCFYLRNNREYKIEKTGLDGKIISYQQVLNINNLSYSNLNGFTVNTLQYNTESKTVEANITYTTDKC
jgi:hypothetical protein